MILLDTNVISEAMRETGDRRVVEWIDAQAIETLFLSTITLAELRFGILALAPGKRRERLRERLEREVFGLFAGRILSFDVAASERYGELMARARHGGRAIGTPDGYIAAIAAAAGFAVATRDGSPFAAVGVPVINPWK